MSSAISSEAQPKRKFVLRIALGFLLLTSGISVAYVLPSSGILRRMTEARDDLHLFTLKVDGAITFAGQTTREAGAAFGLPADRPEIQTDASVLLKLPGRCRVEVNPVEGSHGAAVMSGGKLRVEGREVPALDVAIQQLCAILGNRSSSEGEAKAALVHHLQALKVDLGATSLARFGGQVTYVIGSPKPGKSQFWVYKDEFLPARLLFTDAQGQPWDLRMSDYTSPATGDWFPRVVELYRGEELQVKFTALKADNKSGIADKLF